MTLTFVYRSFEVMSIIASHSPLNNPETVRGLVPKNTNRKWLMGYQMVTWPITSRDPERSNSWPYTLTTQYLENGWRCYV